jgi:hypothetical protein
MDLASTRAPPYRVGMSFPGPSDAAALAVETPPRPARWLWWLPSAAWASGIFYLSSKPIRPPRELFLFSFPHADKVVHAGLFGVLATLVYQAMRRSHGSTRRVAAAVAILVAALYGASDEFHQRFTPHRTSDPFDCAADVTGAAAAVTLLAAAGRRRAARCEVAPAPAVR